MDNHSHTDTPADAGPQDAPIRKDRRRFLRTAGLATAGAVAGLTIPFERHMPKGMTLAAFADDSPLAGKDGLTLLGDRPVNAETPAHLLDDAITPTERHFIRNNGLLPDSTSPEGWTLTVDGFVDNPMTMTIDDLRNNFEVVTRALHIECGGNGRAAFDPPARGNQWTVGAVGCSEWTGVRLKDVLEAAGVQDAAVYTGHEGADIHLSGDPDKFPLSRGIPIEKALDETVLIAFEMNGEALHPMNGAPLRLVVPGWPGSCSQKWLTRIWVRDQEHDGEKMGGQSYRVPAYPVAPGTDVPNEDMVVMGAMPVKSLITFPMNGAESGMETEVRGHAWVGDRTIERLEVSIDFGATWAEADLDAPVNPGAWQNWRTSVSFPQAGYYEVWARATDSEGVSQPHAIAWNPRGYNNNSLHRVGLMVS
ncbi:putative molydopterin binding oxidoreductase [Dinoroseobacter shibae DFL 12 = DSM 16493]|jgi:DMSO/TMAO reductase YedYZ molybdopterin-dependent catalytic subunit|uniref:Putative molydopterin binding oxidoreductase n=1 Tax=Dinoroseobacter shibae (strain DSM 16493 / NCIMB 14021 / DFL 12) TaxID=398580 RepID=A8LKD1_DINSH|nr:sulfite oxidase [Dinoroseobacter shibae]ABV94714.1 putative molydopterin binding oxidoreductase [Dinoroseobacter shibae DFL 12 = DSM 16493]URF46135.1 sulfite oxidase [Dinoroseobacter shibae]URF50442.1 sulfite oxidase [Dinoroseobacter shibae]